MQLRHTLLIRTDLGMPQGLFSAQLAHIAQEVFRQHHLNKSKRGNLDVKAIEWINDPYMFVHGVPNHEALIYFIDQADKQGVVCHTWEDTIFLEIADGQTITLPNVLVGCSFGPDDADRIRLVIGKLPLLK